MFAESLKEETGCDVLLYEYPGYSLSRFTSSNEKKPVKTSQNNVYLSIEAAFRFLINDAKVDVSSIIVYGRSIGSGPSVHLASKRRLSNLANNASPRDIAGLFLVSPFLSTVRAVIGPKTARACCCYDNFPNHSKIKKVETDVAILHARDDDVVAFSNGEKLYESLKNKTFEPCWLDDGEHNYIDTQEIYDYFDKFKTFLKEAKNPTLSREEMRQKRLQNRESTSEQQEENAAPVETKKIQSTQVPQPLLTDFDEEETLEGKIELEEENPETNPVKLSKEEIRKRRLAVMARADNKD